MVVKSRLYKHAHTHTPDLPPHLSFLNVHKLEHVVNRKVEETQTDR